MGSLRLGATADSLGKLPVHAHIEVAALRVGVSVDLPPDPGQLAALRRTPRADRIVRRADLCGCPCVDCRRRITCGHPRWDDATDGLEGSGHLDADLDGNLDSGDAAPVQHDVVALGA